MKSLSRLGRQLVEGADKLRRTPVRQSSRRQEVASVEERVVTPADSEQEREAVLATLPPEYFDEGFDALEHELKQLPLNFEAASLDSVVEERTAVLDVSWAGLPSAAAAWEGRRSVLV